MRRLVAGALAIVTTALVMMPGMVNASQDTGAPRCACITSVRARVNPAPQLVLRVSPNAPRPGDVIIARVSLDAATIVSGQFGARAVRFEPEEAVTTTRAISPGQQSIVALIGLDGLFPAGTYSLAVTATAQDGSASQTVLAINVSPRSKFIERVALSRTLSPTLDPAVNADEAQAFAQIYSVYSARKWWTGPFKLPVSGPFAALYGNRRMYNGIDLGTYHSGYDIVAGKGTPVKAAAPGQVVAVRPFVVHGLTVVIDHGHGVLTAYSHLSQTLVTEGQIVNTGDVIGKVGSTGRSQGPHLHFELAVGGVAVDPGNWLRTALP